MLLCTARALARSSKDSALLAVYALWCSQPCAYRTGTPAPQNNVQAHGDCPHRTVVQTRHFAWVGRRLALWLQSEGGSDEGKQQRGGMLRDSSRAFTVVGRGRASVENGYLGTTTAGMCCVGEVTTLNVNLGGCNDISLRN